MSKLLKIISILIVVFMTTSFVENDFVVFAIGVVGGFMIQRESMQ